MENEGAAGRPRVEATRTPWVSVVGRRRSRCRAVETEEDQHTVRSFQARGRAARMSSSTTRRS